MPIVRIDFQSLEMGGVLTGLEDYYNRVAELYPIEIVWRDRQEYLASRGYLLRTRYRPGWIASWKLDPSIQKPFYTEDFPMAHLLRPNLMDATRVSDGKLVLLKQIDTDSQELKIATHLSSQELRKDPRNHCVPVLDVFPDKDDPSQSYLVMPFMRYVDDPAFDSVQNILDCGEQLLEGLVFLHEQGVAHRDCAYKNIMMDAIAMYPESFHPIRADYLPHDLKQLAPVLSRDQVPVTYYFVDFGISSWFQPDERDRLVLGTSGLDKDVPELSDEVPYDSFKLDIFVLGNMFRENFTAKFSNLDFLTPLLRQMTSEDPALRPTAGEALQRWKMLCHDTWSLQRLWRPRPRDENCIVQAVSDAFSLVSALGVSISGGAGHR